MRMQFLCVLLSGGLGVMVTFTPALAADDSWGKVFAFQVKMANKGSVSAQFMLGEMYQQGRGVKRDYKKALQWYEKARGNGHKQAAARIAQVRELLAKPPGQSPKAVAKVRKKPLQKKILPNTPRQHKQVAKKPVIKKADRKKLITPVVAKPKQVSKPAVQPTAIPTGPDKKRNKVRKPVKTTLMDAIGGFDDEEDTEVVTLEDSEPVAVRPDRAQQRVTEKSFIDVEDAFE